MKCMSLGWIVAALTASVCGCGSDDDGGEQAALEIVGEWTSEFGDETITAEAWGTQSIVEYDNAENVVIVQNADDATFSPGAFNKNVFTEPSGDAFYYCTVDFGLETLEDAQASTKVADDSDPAESGCGGFSWTKLTRK